MIEASSEVRSSHIMHSSTQVKSKWGLAVSAVVTVVASLLMSISICAVFGVTPSVNSGEIFPYLVVIIGLENVLVLTRSVVSTPNHLEVS